MLKPLAPDRAHHRTDRATPLFVATRPCRVLLCHRPTCVALIHSSVEPCEEKSLSPSRALTPAPLLPFTKLWCPLRRCHRAELSCRHRHRPCVPTSSTRVVPHSSHPPPWGSPKAPTPSRLGAASPTIIIPRHGLPPPLPPWVPRVRRETSWPAKRHSRPPAHALTVEFARSTTAAMGSPTPVSTPSFDPLDAGLLLGRLPRRPPPPPYRIWPPPCATGVPCSLWWDASPSFGRPLARPGLEAIMGLAHWHSVSSDFLFGLNWIIQLEFKSLEIC
jgi:hypothetical protein